jgi:hypothetical protein
MKDNIWQFSIFVFTGMGLISFNPSNDRLKSFFSSLRGSQMNRRVLQTTDNESLILRKSAINSAKISEKLQFSTF